MRDNSGAADNSGYPRLEDKIAWYDKRSLSAQRYFMAIKTAQIVVAALIPVTALIDRENNSIPGILGAVVLILEGLQELGMFRQNWQKYRSSCEALRHEKYLYLAVAGPFAGLADDERMRLLAERVEQLIALEHSNWVAQFEDNVSESSAKKKL
ncbi:MAG: DUF4231 domain-containing protein [Pseudomonadota bacterium]